jgi:glycosyltransferase involved in cell wall biosynthesis
MKGWLVNDCLTCIPGTRTFWHDLLDGIESLVDMTNGYTDYKILAREIERALESERPDYIIRNASWFPPINTDVPQIAIAQDLGHHCVAACNQAAIVVANSRFTMESLTDVKSKKLIVPLGVDMDVFKFEQSEELIADVVYVGDSSEYPKSFSTVSNLIRDTNFTFNLVMKDDFRIDHPRVRCFNRVDSNMVKKVLSSSQVAICPSYVETQHLAGIEAMACNTPVVAVSTGIYYEIEDGKWGLKTQRECFIEKINEVLNCRDKFSPREFVFEYGLDKDTCMARWNNLISEVVPCS